MTLRVIVRTDDAGMAANVGGAVHTEFKTFDIEAPAIEAFLTKKLGSLSQRQVVGVHLVCGDCEMCGEPKDGRDHADCDKMPF